MKFSFRGRRGWFLVRRETGAATLVIVMALFLVVGLLAAYANRSILFEQRIAGTYYRGALAQELAEAGIEWEVAMMNAGGIDDHCRPSSSGSSYVGRYFRISETSRIITLAPSINYIDGTYFASCYRSAQGGWTCGCAGEDYQFPVAGGSAYLQPSFGVFAWPLGRPGVFRVDSTGCTVADIRVCATQRKASLAREAGKTTQAVVGLISAVRSPPASPLTVKGDLSISGGGLGLHNSDPRTAGMLLVAGGTSVGLADSRLESLPGTPAASALIVNDPALKNGEVFRMFLGMTPSRYAQHPALRVVTCGDDCSSALTTAYASGKRMLWVNGDLTIDSNISLGTADDPLVLIATGNVTITGAFKFAGLLVARGDLDWTASTGSNSVITGAVVVEGDLATTGNMDIAYVQTVADRLRNSIGSYARVPGGWFD